jgi:hypothetical protein
MREGCVIGILACSPATNHEAEHDEVLGYEELPGDDVSIFDCDDSFDLLAGVPKWHDKPSHEPCVLVNPIQGHSPSINLWQEMNPRHNGDGVAVWCSMSEALLYAKRTCGFVSVTTWTFIK